MISKLLILLLLLLTGCATPPVPKPKAPCYRPMISERIRKCTEEGLSTRRPLDSWLIDVGSIIDEELQKWEERCLR